MEIRTEVYDTKGTKLSKINPRWWQLKDDELHNHVVKLLADIKSRQDSRRRKLLHLARLYSNEEFLAMTIGGYSKVASGGSVIDNRVKLNVCKAVVDTAQAKIAKNKAKPMFLTEGGDPSMQRRAKKLTQYCAGLFEEQRLYTKGQDVFKHAGILGTGALKFYEEDGGIKTEQAYIHELYIDDAEAFYGNPRSLFQVRAVHRDVLMDRFPERIEDIRRAKNVEVSDGGSFAGDLVELIEAWHLPTNAKDGKHALLLDSVTLSSEAYTKSYFPFRLYRWNRPVFGLWGAGIVEDIQGIQIEINKLLRDIQVTHDRVVRPRVWIEASSPQMSITNQIGGIHRYLGQKPIFETAEGLPPELYNHLWQLYEKAFETSGVSQLSSTGKKPPGLESGRALREYSDIESERFVIAAQDFEQFYLDCAEIFVDMSKDLYKDNPKLSVKTKNKKFIETIQWKDVDMEGDKFQMDTFPVALLSGQPAAKLDRVRDLINDGLIDREYAMSLLDFPDIESAVSVETAALELAKAMLEEIVAKGIPQTPEPYMNLELTRRLAVQTYLKYRVDGLEEERLEMLRQFILALNDMIAATTAAAVPTPAAAPQPAAAPLPPDLAQPPLQ